MAFRCDGDSLKDFQFLHLSLRLKGALWSSCKQAKFLLTFSVSY